MMVSPECYYLKYLKGKNADEIWAEIFSLENKIESLMDIVKHPEREVLARPSASTRIQCYREYIERAHQALEELEALPSGRQSGL